MLTLVNVVLVSLLVLNLLAEQPAFPTSGHTNGVTACGCLQWEVGVRFRGLARIGRIGRMRFGHGECSLKRVHCVYRPAAVTARYFFLERSTAGVQGSS